MSRWAKLTITPTQYTEKAGPYCFCVCLDIYLFPWLCWTWGLGYKGSLSDQKLSFSGASPKGKFGEATDMDFRGRGTKVCGVRRLLSISLCFLSVLETDYGR